MVIQGCHRLPLGKNETNTMKLVIKSCKKETLEIYTSVEKEHQYQ